MINKSWLLFFIVFVHFTSSSQSISVSFFKLSSPEKYWVIFHPFKAKQAFIITREVLKTTDSISKTDLLDNDINGGQLDAFKHSYWMAHLTQEIGSRSALKLGDAHEKGNYRSYKKGLKEDGYLPDHPSSKMDLFNNKVGVKIIENNPDLNRQGLISITIDEIKNGSMKILKKDEQGNFLTCSGEILSKENLIGKWENDKCSVSSNTKNNNTN